MRLLGTRADSFSGRAVNSIQVDPDRQRAHAGGRGLHSRMGFHQARIFEAGAHLVATLIQPGAALPLWLPLLNPQLMPITPCLSRGTAGGVCVCVCGGVARRRLNINWIRRCVIRYRNMGFGRPRCDRAGRGPCPFFRRLSVYSGKMEGDGC